MRLSSCVATLSILAVVTLAQKNDPNLAKPAPGLHDILLKKMHDTASYLGFGVKCRNGGHKTEENECLCMKYFKGKECETRVCINGGRLERLTVPTIHHVCKCPHPAFITGEHCEKIKCDNKGVLKTFINGTWNCDCTDTRFYGGMFCEKFIVSSGWIMGILSVAVLLIVIFICSTNWFSRKRSSHNLNRRNVLCPSRPSGGRRGVAAHHRGGVSYRSNSADDLISSERGGHRRTAAYPEGVTQQYVVRLDTIPTFNPTMIGGVEPLHPREQTPVGPPPSYDQAMSSLRVEPPEYTPTDSTKVNA